MNRTPLLGLGLALLIVAGAFLLVREPEPTGPGDAAAGSSSPAPGAAATPTGEGAAPLAASADTDPSVVQVWKSPTCGCCTEWIAHMEAAGFTVEARDVADPTAVKNQYGVPGPVRACHTALVGGYLVEGHVPAEDVQRLLEERPRVAGIAVPGMPIGSPGMEVGDQKEPYDVLTFTGEGSTAVYSSH